MPDPLPVFEAKFYCTTAAQAMQQFDATFFDATGGLAPYITSVYTLLEDGFRGWGFEVDTGTLINRTSVVCVNSSGDIPYPVVAGISGSEFRTIGTTQVNLDEFPDLDFAGFQAWMADVYLSKKVEILEWITDSTISVLDVDGQTIVAGSVGVVTAVLQASDGLTYYTITDTYGYTNYVDTVNITRQIYLTGTSLSSAPAQTIQGLDRVASAVEDIAGMDTDISLNHGSVVYSVRGRTLVTP